MKRFALLTLLIVSPHLYGLDNTFVFELDGAWDKDNRQKTEMEMRWELDHNLTDNISLSSIVRARGHGPNSFDPDRPDSDAVSPASRRHYLNDTAEIELRELYADVRLPNGNLRLGKQQIVWGQADGLKLLDVINPQDFREFILDDFEDSRIPVWTVNLEIFLSQGDLQLVWIPDTTRHNLPPEGATFALTAPFASIPNTQPFRLESIDRPNNWIEDGVWAARFSTFQGGWDITVNYLYRFNNLPVVRKSIDFTGVLSLSPEYERTHTIGGSLSKAFGDFIFRSELAFNDSIYFDTEDIRVNKGVAKAKEVGYVVGIDWSGLSNTLVSAQVFQSLLVDENKRVDFVRDDVESTFTFLVRRSFLNESFVGDVLWIYNVNNNDHLARAKLDYEWSSNLTVGIYADWFSGSPSELFGQYDDRDRVGFSFRYGF